MRFRLLLSGLLGLALIPNLGAFAQTSPPEDKEPDAPGYVGSETCQGCHEDAYQSFAKSAHAETLKSKKPASRGCEACHGAGAAHVETGGDPTAIRTYAGASAQSIVGRCQRCHQSQQSDHGKAKPHCLACHSVHHYKQQKYLLLQP